ncbi:DUF2628 domain-containing protein [Phreatobacter sp.]|uniref:DUF2628 domain-containing protein n=1 Tax=Phreatobacter sp. TaxID=1966341 RepID=UPI003F7220DF
MARLTSYTVHVPPPKAGRDEDVATQFVADAFSWVAFLMPWLWFLWHRMWLATLGYLVLMAAIMAAAITLGVTPNAGVAVAAAFNLLVGLEATNIRRRKLRWLGYEEAGVVVARNREEAERRWFTEQAAGRAPASPPDRPAAFTPAAPMASASAPASASGSGIIGLFPDADPAARGGR